MKFVALLTSAGFVSGRAMTIARFGVLASIFALMGYSQTASAAVIETDSYQESSSYPFTPTYAAPAGDILLGATPTSSTGNFAEEGSGGIPVLTNGVFGPITGINGTNPSFATAGLDGGTQLIYTLAGPVTLGSVVTLGGWNDGGRDVQSYTVLYKVGSGSFTQLAVVDYDPTAAGAASGGDAVATQVILSGFNIADVTALEFNFAGDRNGHQGYAELAATLAPEPSSIVAFCGLGAMGLFMAVRRRRKA
jgi:hypothetical protein